ncbi:MAG: DUF559 domain-containing protein [Lewinellaceae bacterium]|nr:DUF559 domain-containing protein [Lewinellaceae bacterium]
MEKASPKNNYHYNPRLQPLARSLRNNMTKAEACLWKYILRAGSLSGYKFKRQRPVLNYIADFMCPKLMLIIEVDGIIHEMEAVMANDEARQKNLEAIGFTVLRFTNWEVLNQMGEVSATLNAWVEEWEATHDNGGM